MRGKFFLMVFFIAGYILGAKAGRERYEQIKNVATKVWESDLVQKQNEKLNRYGKKKLIMVFDVGAKSLKGIIDFSINLIKSEEEESAYEDKPADSASDKPDGGILEQEEVVTESKTEKTSPKKSTKKK